MRDYYVAVDENGQPYIAHGVFDRIKDSKYYQKIKTGYGWRYFYDPEEWKAYIEGQGNKPTSLVGKVKDTLGFDERERYNRATDRAANSNIFNRERREREAEEARGAYAQTALGKAENARNAIGNAYNSARTGISNARESIENFGRQAREDIENSPGAKAIRGVQSAVNTAADKLGFDERQRYKDNPNDETREEYENTALGKAEKTFGQIKDKATRMREEFQKQAEERKYKSFERGYKKIFDGLEKDSTGSVYNDFLATPDERKRFSEHVGKGYNRANVAYNMITDKPQSEWTQSERTFVEDYYNNIILPRSKKS